MPSFTPALPAYFLACLWALLLFFSSPAVAANNVSTRFVRRQHGTHLKRGWSSHRAVTKYLKSGDSSGEPRVTKFSSRGPLGLRTDAMNLNQVYVGFIIEGQSQTMEKINKMVGHKSAGYGKYTQLPADGQFDGKQLLWIMDDVKNCDCVFQPAIMPVHGWNGLKMKDNRQAVAIAKVLRKFTDAGIPVWLRIAHEVNWYQRDGTYKGTANDFKEAWHVIAQAIRTYAPDVLLWWNPNIASMEEYAKYEPWDMGTVDLVGVDYYPKKKSTVEDFVKIMKPFHDKYAVNGRKFALGEAGIYWLEQLGKARPLLPNFVALTWYNCEKEWNYKLVGTGLDNQALSAKFEK